MRQASEFRVLITYPNLTMMLVPSIAVAILSAVLKKQGYQVELFDTTHYLGMENSSPQNRVKFLQAREFDETNDLGVRVKTDLIGDYRLAVEKFQPDLILFSVVEDCFKQAVWLIESIASLSIPHLLGGVFPTAAPNECFKYSDAVHAIGVGECEEMVVSFAEAIRLGKPQKGIPGVWLREADGNLHRGGHAPLTDINQTTPDFALFEAERFNRPMGGKIFRTIPVETYRGCPYTCTFCNSPMHNESAKQNGFGSFLRRKSMSTLKAEFDHLVQTYSPEFLYFVDDSFLARPKSEIYRFCELYEDYQIPFWFNTRPETASLEILQRLKDVGAYRISFGIESGNENFRKKVLQRRGTNSEIQSQFKTIAESEVPFSLNLLIGTPGETREMVMDTVRFVKSLSGFDTVTASIFTPYHGTKARELAVQRGWLPDDYITKHTTSSSALRMPPPYLSAAEIDGLMRVIPLYVYFSEDKWSYIRRAEATDDEGERVLSELSEIYRINFLGEDQFSPKVLLEGGTGCRSNHKESLLIPHPI